MSSSVRCSGLAKYSFGIGLVVVLIGLSVSPAFGQTGLDVGTEAGLPGSTVDIPIAIQGPPAAAAQLDLLFDPLALESGSPGDGTVFSDHVLDFAVVSPGRLRITVTTATATPLSTGILFTVPFTIASTAPIGLQLLDVENVVLADAGALGLATAVSPGAVDVLGSPTAIPVAGPMGLGILVLMVSLAGFLMLRLGRSGSAGGGALMVLLFAMVSALGVAAPVAAQGALPGDANLDGLVNADDIQLIVDQILERGAAPGDPDCDQNGVVDVRDTICVVIHGPPVIDPISDQGALSDTLFSLQVSASDPDAGDVLTHSLDQAPSGMTIDPSGGLIEWTPSAAQAGPHSVTVRVTDPRELFDTESFEVTVDGDNSPPVLQPINDLSVVEREVVALRADASDPDLPGDTLTWSLIQAPVGATIDPTEGTLLWIPTVDQVGPQSFTVQVMDAAGEFDQEGFTVSVRALGSPPVITEIADREVFELSPLTIAAVATDPDLPGDVLTFDLLLAPAGLTVNPSTGVIAWTPTSAQIGRHDVTVRVTDQEGLLDFTSFQVLVRRTNAAPIAMDDLYEARLGETLVINAPGVLTNDSDPNGDPLTAAVETPPTLGELVLAPDGSFTYLLEAPDLTTDVDLELLCSAVKPTSGYQMNATLAVGDVDNDGDIEIVGASGLTGATFLAEVWILNAGDCSEQGFIDLEASGGFYSRFHVGLIDLDGDGDLEIIGLRDRFPADQGGAFDSRHLVAVHHDGTLVWTNPSDANPNDDGSSEDSPLLNLVNNSWDNGAGATFADLDADGTIEIIMTTRGLNPDLTSSAGIVVFNAEDGSLAWEFLSGTTHIGVTDNRPPTIVDLDMDGTMEVIAHRDVVDHTGTLEFTLPGGAFNDGYATTAVANFDDDVYPEILARDLSRHYLIEHDGTEAWRIDRVNATDSQWSVADFDGDGVLEYAHVNRRNGLLNCYMEVNELHDPLIHANPEDSILWSHEGDPNLEVERFLCRQENITAFDANRDGAMDLVFHNEGLEKIFIIDGRDGSVLTEVEAGMYSGAQQAFVSVADVDLDGGAELITSWDSGGQGETRIYTGTEGNPLPYAPPFRNQWIFSEAYATDHGKTMRTNPVPHWLQSGRNGWNLISSERQRPLDLQLQCEAATADGSEFQGNGTIAVGDVDGDGDIELVGSNIIDGLTFISDIWILNATDCSEQALISVEDAGGFSWETHLGLIDLDGDGDLEIIGTRTRYPLDQGGASDSQHLLAVHHDGSLAWPGDGGTETSPFLDAQTNNSPYRYAGPIFADLDADGTVEIVMGFSVGINFNVFSGVVVYNAEDGSLAWEFTSDVRHGAGNSVRVPTVSDLDLDGTMEVVIHNSVLDHQGGLEQELPSAESIGSSTPGYLVTAVANFDDDAYPEIIARDYWNHYLFEHDGTVKWELDRQDSTLSQITVADFDGDGEVEYAQVNCGELVFNSCGNYFLEVNDTDGTLMWSHQGVAALEIASIYFRSENITAFDANRDGAFDLVFRNETPGISAIFIVDGRDGSVLESIPAPSYFSAEQSFVTVADVDGDGQAEVINSYTGGIVGQTQIWGGTDARPLPSAPPFRNQWVFAEAYASEDGKTMAPNPVPHWLQSGRNGWNLITPEPDPLLGTQQSFTYRANDGALDSDAATVTFDILPPGNPPRFLSEPDALTTRGFQYRYAPIVVDPDVGDTVSFLLTAGPTGMSIDPATGALTWQPDANGTYPVTILATDTRGFAADQSWDLVVGDPVTVPDVIGQPQATAESTIVGANLLVGSTTASSHPVIPAGAVSAQSPIGGSVAEFGADVALVISTGPAPEDIDDDLDTFTENEGDCNDGDNSIFPGAPDPLGDGIDQDCDGFDGSEIIAEIVVEPGTLDLLAGETRQLQAFAIFGDGTSQIATGLAAWQSLNASTATVVPGGGLTAIADAGPAKITATVDGVVGSATVTVTDTDNTDDDAPAVEITSPTDGESVFGPVDILGTANDPNLVRYELALSPAGESAFTLIRTSTTPVAGGVLGELDPTLLLNGLYTLRLTVLDAGGNQTIDEITVQVDGQQKVGNFTLGFVDLEIPVAGLPIQVIRTYDSRDKRRGDFGIGWRQGYRTVEISCTESPGEGWQVVKSGLAWSLVPTRLHRCTIDRAGQRAEAFDFVPNPQVSPIVPFSLLSGSYQPVGGTIGTLELVEPANLLIADPQPGPVRLVNDNDLTVFSPQGFRYTAPDGTIFTFGEDGLEQIEDPNGNTVTLTADGIEHSSGLEVIIQRDAQGRIVEITDPEGHVQRYTYSVAGDLIAHADQLDNTTRFFYDRNHGLLRIEDPLGRPVSRTEYDDDGRVVAITDADGNRIEVNHDLAGQVEIQTDPDGSQDVYEYDEQGNVTRHVDGVGAETTWTYDDAGNILTMTNPRGGVTTTTWNDDDRPLTVTDPAGDVTTYTYDDDGNRTSVTDGEGAVTVFEYDSRGNVTRIIDPEGGVTDRAYDADGNLASVTDPLGNVVQLQYDGFGRLESRTDANGSTVSYTYDANGRRLTEEHVVTGPDGPRTLSTEHTYDDAGQLTSTTFPDGSQRSVERDGAGNLTASVDPLGRRTEMDRDWAGRPTRVSLPDGEDSTILYGFGERVLEVEQRSGVQLSWEYDGADRATTFVLPDDTPSSADNPRFDVQYAPDGLPLALEAPGGGTTEFEHDALGRLRATRDPLGRGVLHRYDGAGRVVEEEDALGLVTAHAYDANGRRTRTTWPDGTEHTMTYDAAGRLTSHTDEEGETTFFEYDGVGRLTTVIDPVGSRTEYAYDEAGNLVAQTDALGRTTRWEYDNLGRQTALIRPAGQKATFAYDLAGNLISRTDFNGAETTFQYSDLDQLIRIQYPDSSFVEIEYDLSGRRQEIRDARGTTTFGYDTQGQLVQRTDPDGTTIAYTYDVSGRVRTITTPDGTTTYGYDLAGSITSVTDSDGGVTTFAYDAVGNLERIDRPNGWYELIDHDVRNRPVMLEVLDQDDSLVDVWTYQYDLDGILAVADGSRGRREWTYDDADRLVSEFIRNPDSTVRTIDYTYDEVGNRLTRNDSDEGATSYSYDINDRLLEVVSGGTSVQFTWDDNGNLMSMTGAAGTSTYTWNAENRLVSVSVPGSPGQMATYEYDLDGLRTSATINGVEDRFLWDTNRELAMMVEEYRPGSSRIPYVYGNGLLAQGSGASREQILQDIHSGVRRLANTTGNSTGEFSYDAFGRHLDPAGAPGPRFQYRAEQQDPASGWTYLRARSYDPEVGRFVSEDPFEGILEDPRSRHRYLYAHASPISFSDPTGQTTLGQVVAYGAALSAIIVTVGVTGGAMLNTLVSGFFDTYEWNGELAAFGLSVYGPFGLAALTYEATSDCHPNRSNPQDAIIIENQSWLSIMWGAGIGLPASATGGSFTMNSPIAPSWLLGGETMLSGPSLVFNAGVLAVDQSGISIVSTWNSGWSYGNGNLGSTVGYGATAVELLAGITFPTNNGLTKNCTLGPK
jgi:RHS repeat-associated protein